MSAPPEVVERPTPEPRLQATAELPTQPPSAEALSPEVPAVSVVSPEAIAAAVQANATMFAVKGLTQVAHTPFIVFESGPYAGRSFRLTAPETRVGRSRAGMDISLAAEPKASRTHARVYQQGETWVIEDLGSTNGTFVAGRRVSTETLRDGVEIRIGDSVGRFRVMLGE